MKEIHYLKIAFVVLFLPLINNTNTVYTEFNNKDNQKKIRSSIIITPREILNFLKQESKEKSHFSTKFHIILYRALEIICAIISIFFPLLRSLSSVIGIFTKCLQFSTFSEYMVSASLALSLCNNEEQRPLPTPGWYTE